MDRVWAFSAYLGTSALWWGGIGEQWWRRHRISPRIAAGVAGLVGASGWLPSPDGCALGSVVLAVGGLAVLMRERSFRGWLTWVTCAGLWWMIQARPDPVFGSCPGFWLTAAGVGLVGKLMAADPVTALVAVTGAGAVATWARWVWSGSEALAMGRSQLALVAVSGMVAWVMVTLGIEATRWRYRRRQPS